jgi:CO/xanthine dehydrogenase FAD-binding subunit
MHAFGFAAPARTDEALRLATPGSAFLAGGTTLVDLMKLDVLTSDQVIDINDLPLRGIRSGTDGLRIGALERMSDVAAHDAVPPVVAQALLASASPQLRNMASIGGNLLQRTVAATSATFTRRATNDGRAAAARPRTGRTACTPSWAPAGRAARRTPATWPSRSSR